MNDKEIRKILIEYLKINHKEYRIYQEKSIGTSICDLMLVTNKLTGFEIKSDSDNYDRLRRQISAYNMFFDENYIVVGRSHIKSAQEKVPEEWGILAISKANIEKIREAKPNKSVIRARQLSILWKIELKNILLKNNMPLYAQKEKEFIASQIAKEVEPKLLGKQIAEELLSRDYSAYDAQDYTIKSGEKDKDDIAENNFADSLLPAEELIDRLSEENLANFTLDKWMSIYKRAVEKQNLKEKKNAEFDEQLREKRKTTIKIPYTEIDVSLGVPWISEEIISAFAIEVLKVPQQYIYAFDNQLKTYYPKRKDPIVKHEPITGHWYVKKYFDIRSTELVSIYGTTRYNAMYVLEATLNLREIKIHDGTKYNEAETIAALERQKALKAAFRDWVWKNEDRRAEIEEAYNRLFADYEVQTYDGSKIAFEGINPAIPLYDYQKNAVQKIISTPNTLLSFDVGAGKTYIMIASAMEMRKSGLSRKNLFVVPNNIVGQWEKMFTTLYPSAKVLTVEPKSFTPEKRKKVLGQIKTEDYDGIIMAYSCFDMIPLSSAYLIDDMNEALMVLKNRLDKNVFTREPSSYGATALKNEMQYIKKTINDLIDCIDTPCEISFDELEINTLFVDEAHNFKNIPLRTNLRNLRGINTTGSKKCLEMLKKVEYVQKTNGGRGVVFATGTPLSNSISDTYAMQLYLQGDELRKKGLERFDNWVKTFAQPEEVCEIDVDTSGFRVIWRFTKFFNLRELSHMFSQVSIFYNVNQDGLPKLLGYSDVVIEKGPELEAYMQKLYKRTEAIREKKVDRKEDNMLKITTDGRKAALSLALVNETQIYDETSKVFNCIKNVMEIYKKYDACSQLIFCDYSTPKANEYSVYKELKEKLIECGVNPKEIAFIHSCKNEEQKVKLYEAVNQGKVRILIGSTFKLGIGANVQTRLKAIHHLDVPWRPADMVQREGRILRRGNENEEINIFRYIVEGSFDSYSWQILQTKQHFISQFLSGNNTTRSIEDFDNDELNYAQVKALALCEPLMKDYVEKENALRNARIILRQELIQKENAKNELANIKNDIKNLNANIAKSEQTELYIKENAEEIKSCLEEVASIITEKIFLASPNESIASIKEFIFKAPIKQGEKKPFIIVSRGGIDYYVELSDSISGNKTRLLNFFTRFEAQIAARKKKVSDLEAKKTLFEEQIKYSSKTSEKIEALEKEIEEIFGQIKINQRD